MKHQGNDLPDGGRGIKPLLRFWISKSESYFCSSHFCKRFLSFRPLPRQERQGFYCFKVVLKYGGLLRAFHSKWISFRIELP